MGSVGGPGAGRAGRSPPRPAPTAHPIHGERRGYARRPATSTAAPHGAGRPARRSAFRSRTSPTDAESAPARSPVPPGARAVAIRPHGLPVRRPPSHPLSVPAPVDDERAVREILDQVAQDLSMICDRPVEVLGVETERARSKPAASGGVHVSFKLGFQRGAAAHHGCFLVPLPDAISLACYLMLVSDEDVARRRASRDLDHALKDALLEVGNMVGGSVDAALRAGAEQHAPRVCSEGCQGVRPGQRPGFARRADEELVVGRARARVASFPPFEALLLLPAACLPGPGAAAA